MWYLWNRMFLNATPLFMMNSQHKGHFYFPASPGVLEGTLLYRATAWSDGRVANDQFSTFDYYYR